MIKKYILIYIIISCYYCSYKKIDNNNHEFAKSEISDKDNEEGFKLLNAYCYECHKVEDDLKSPSFSTMKYYYKEKFPVYQDFENRIIEFMKNYEVNPIIPNREDIYDKIPEIDISDENLKKISKYLYYNDINNEVFMKHKLEYKLDNTQLEKIINGKEIISSISNRTKDGKYTSEDCDLFNFFDDNLLSNSYQKYNIKIRSDRNRNPINKTSVSEKKILQKVRNKYYFNKELYYNYIEKSNSYYGYYPIVTVKSCLKCHGEVNKTINKDIYNRIKDKYPNDKSIGFNENEIIGLFILRKIKL